MDNKSTQKPPVLIQIDCDGALALSNHYHKEVVRQDDSDRIFFVLKEFLNIFSHYGIKATLFVCGCDIENKEKRTLLKEALHEGHELANHTYSHPGAFLSLKQEKIVEEIVKTQELIARYLNIQSHGFRAPNFELNKDLMKILSNEGLTYDCSMLPTPFSPLIRTMKRIVSRGSANITSKHGYMGPFQFGFGPRIPYRPSRILLNKPGKGKYQYKTVEIPVTVSPLLKLPIHSSYALSCPETIGRAVSKYTFNWIAKKNLPLVYVFHLADLAEAGSLRGIEGKLYQALETRTRFVHWILDEICQQFQSITTIELVRSLNF